MRKAGQKLNQMEGLEREVSARNAVWNGCVERNGTEFHLIFLNNRVI